MFVFQAEAPGSTNRVHLRPLNFPFARLAHTAKVQEAVFLGMREEADAALASVRRLHEQVKGMLPEDAGVRPPGTHFSALDPRLRGGTAVPS